MNSVPKTKAELFKQMDESWSELDRVIRGLSDAQLAESSPPDGWSIQDHLVHLAIWARGIAALLRKENRWAVMGFDAQFISQSLSEDQQNEFLRQNSQHLTPGEARASFREAHQQVKQAVDRLEDADLFKPYTDYQPGESGKGETRLAIEWVLGDTVEHYDAHIAWIEDLIARRKPAG